MQPTVSRIWATIRHQYVLVGEQTEAGTSALLCLHFQTVSRHQYLFVLLHFQTVSRLKLAWVSALLCLHFQTVSRLKLAWVSALLCLHAFRQ